MDCGAEYCPATFYFPPALALALLTRMRTAVQIRTRPEL